MKQDVQRFANEKLHNLKQMFPGKILVGIHIRMEDITRKTNGRKVAPPEFYHKAMTYFRHKLNDVMFLVVSSKPIWFVESVMNLKEEEEIKTKSDLKQKHEDADEAKANLFTNSNHTQLGPSFHDFASILRKLKSKANQDIILLPGSDVALLPRGQSAACDLELLSKLDHIIITVGTFGWFAAYKSKGTVVAFKNFYEPGSPFAKAFQHCIDDYFYPGWILM